MALTSFLKMPVGRIWGTEPLPRLLTSAAPEVSASYNMQDRMCVTHTPSRPRALVTSLSFS